MNRNFQVLTSCCSWSTSCMRKATWATTNLISATLTITRAPWQQAITQETQHDTQLLVWGNSSLGTHATAGAKQVPIPSQFIGTLLKQYLKFGLHLLRIHSVWCFGDADHRQTVGDLQLHCRLLKQIRRNIGKLLVICSSVADCWKRYRGTSANCWWSAVLLQIVETDTVEHRKLLVICSSVADCWKRYSGTSANCWWSAVLLQIVETDTVEHRKLLVICSSVADCWKRYSGTSANCWWSAVLLQIVETDTVEHCKLLVICSSVTDCWRWLQPELKVCSVQVSFVDVTSLFSGTVSIIHIASHKQRCLFKTSTVDPVTLLCSCHGGSESIGPVCFWNILPVIKGWFTCGH